MTTLPRPLPDALRAIEGVEGWLTEAQAARLHRAARAVPAGGRIVEIGSFRGRSTVVLASGADPAVEVVAIDPHAGTDRGPQEIEGYAAEAADDNRAFEANLEAAGVRDRVRHVRAFSDDAHGEVDDPLDVLFVDGAHRFGPARSDLVSWGRRVRPGGTMLVHDAFSSIGVTLALLAAVAGRDSWRYEGRSGSLAEYRRLADGRPNRLTQVAAHLAQLPWFARNVVIKVLIVARLGRLTRFLGHREPTWPY